MIGFAHFYKNDYLWKYLAILTDISMTTLTNGLSRMVKSLDERKYRRREMAFKAEGTKCVLDTLPFFSVRYLLAKEGWIKENNSVCNRLTEDIIVQCSGAEIAKMSSLVTPTDVIAVYDIPEVELNDNIATTNLVLALDSIQDPGNLGTIIRVADWFGIRNILCGIGTVDCYSPKVIQATMGSISRVRLHYGNLPEMISSMGNVKVYGTFLNGNNISTTSLASTGIIVIGNEGNGISSEVENVVTDRILIPSYPPGEPTGESLNAAIATAITLAKFRGI